MKDWIIAILIGLFILLGGIIIIFGFGFVWNCYLDCWRITMPNETFCQVCGVE